MRHRSAPSAIIPIEVNALPTVREADLEATDSGNGRGGRVLYQCYGFSKHGPGKKVVCAWIIGTRKKGVSCREWSNGIISHYVKLGNRLALERCEITGAGQQTAPGN